MINNYILGFFKRPRFGVVVKQLPQEKKNKYQDIVLVAPNGTINFTQLRYFAESLKHDINLDCITIDEDLFVSVRALDKFTIISNIFSITEAAEEMAFAIRAHSWVTTPYTANIGYSTKRSLFTWTNGSDSMFNAVLVKKEFEVYLNLFIKLCDLFNPDLSKGKKPLTETHLLNQAEAEKVFFCNLTTLKSILDILKEMK